MSKLVKKLMADELRKSFSGVSDVVVLSLNGIDGIQNNNMRLALRQKQIRIRVVPNNLARRVFADMGLDPVNQFLDGPSAVAWGGPSVVELAKEITAWASKLAKIEIKGGTSNGLPLTPAQVKALATLPSREELLARVVGLALSPARRVVSLATAPAARIAGQLKSMAEAQQESAEAQPAAAPA